MTAFVYRLQLLLEQKEEAKKEAERELARQEEELQTQLGVLEELKQRERELAAKREKLLRNLLVPDLEQPLSARQVQGRSEYIRVVGIQIEEANGDVLVQQTMVETCESQVEVAKERVEESRREVEVLTKHRSRQEERFLREERAKEDLALDEIGNVLYTNRRSEA